VNEIIRNKNQLEQINRFIHSMSYIPSLKIDSLTFKTVLNKMFPYDGERGGHLEDDDELDESYDGDEDTEHMLIKPVANFPNYTISSDGLRIQNINTGCNVQQFVKLNGYVGANLNNTSQLVHRLVLMTFKGPPDDGETCDHIDRNKTNNDISNLRWASRELQANNSNIPTERINRLKRVVSTDSSGNTVTYLGSREAATAIKPDNTTLQSAMSKISAAITTGKKAWGYTLSRPVVIESENFTEIPAPFIRDAMGYKISKTGIVQFPDRSLKTGWKDGSGYLKVSIERKSYSIHRLVAAAFLYMLDSQSAQHIDGDKNNNNLDNIRIININRIVDHKTERTVKPPAASATNSSEYKSSESAIPKLKRKLIDAVNDSKRLHDDKKREWCNVLSILS
jgi:HNH endonuclease